MARNISLHGTRGEPYYGAQAHRASVSTGQIWHESPRWALEQGQLIVFAPDLAMVSDGTADDTRAAGANDGVDFGGYGAWLVEGSAAGTSEVFASQNGRLVMTTNALDNDYLTVVAQGGGDALTTPAMTLGPFQPLAGTKITMGIRLKIDDVTQSDLLVGLGEADGDLVGGTAEGIYIRKDDADTQPDFVLESSSTETVVAGVDRDAAAVNLADDTYIEMGFVINGITSAVGYFNGWPIAHTVFTNLPTGRLFPVLQIQNGEAAAKTLTVERWVITQTMV
jgi:hypothetical protein